MDIYYFRINVLLRFLKLKFPATLACVAADSFPFSGGAEIEHANEKRASEGARLG